MDEPEDTTGLVFDESHVFGDNMDVYERAEMSRHVESRGYDREWKHFNRWLDKHGHK